MIDPTFFDPQTKRALHDRKYKGDSKLFQKDLIVKELLNLQQRKFPYINVSKKS